jgi:uncharacterized protein
MDYLSFVPAWLGIPTADLAVAIVITALAAILQGTIGLGFAVMSVPLLLLVDPRLAPGPQLLVTLPLTLATCWREREGVCVRSACMVLGGRVPGTLLGVLLLKWAAGAWLHKLIGGIVLVASLVLVSPYQFKRTKLTEFVAGVFSGVGSMVAAIGGPPLALVFSGSTGPQLRSNLAFIFAVGVVFTICVRWGIGELGGQDLRIAIVLLPGMLLGFHISTSLKAFFSGGKRLRVAVCILCLSAAMMLLYRDSLG